MNLFKNDKWNSIFFKICVVLKIIYYDYSIINLKISLFILIKKINFSVVEGGAQNDRIRYIKYI